MQATFSHNDPSGYGMIHVEHRGERLEFNGAVYAQAFKKGVYEPFEQINRYWERLDQNEQDRLFSMYLEAKNIFNEVHVATPLILSQRPIVSDILKFHDVEEFDRWTQYHGKIWIPEDLDVEYKQDVVRPHTRDQTYLVPDYWELVFMVMRLRSIAPIWGEFVEATKKESGQTFRDINAYYLISKTTVDRGEAMKRLNRYVAKNLKEDGVDFRSSLNGIGSDMFQPNLIANILVRFLAIASLTRAPSDTHLVQIAHKTLRNRLSQNESHQNAVLPKLNPGEESDSEDSSSHAEKYKNKPLVPPGEFTVIAKATEYTHEIAARLLLKNELTPEEGVLLESALASAEKMSSRALEECQIRLIRWVVDPIIPARSLWDIQKSSVLRAAGIAQLVLWQTGYKDLAVFTTARNMKDEKIGTFGAESRAHIPKELIDRINELYPYFRRHPTKKAVKTNNEAVTEIMSLSQDLSKDTWFLNMPDKQIAELKGSSANKTHRVSSDIRIRLAELAISRQLRNQSFLSLYEF